MKWLTKILVGILKELELSGLQQTLLWETVHMMMMNSQKCSVHWASKYGCYWSSQTRRFSIQIWMLLEQPKMEVPKDWASKYGGWVKYWRSHKWRFRISPGCKHRISLCLSSHKVGIIWSDCLASVIYSVHLVRAEWMQKLHKMPYAAKAKTQQFSRRKPNLMKKADQLARLCHADVALIIRRNGRYYTYRSTDHEQWPPTRSEIASNIPIYRA